MRKIIVTVAPVCHVGKEIPTECKNPLTPEEITEDVVNCYKAGACQVHLHTRDLEGNPTFELDVFSKTIGMIREQAPDIIIQGSTGGLSTLSLEQRCVSLNVPEVEIASLNMGSVNFGGRSMSTQPLTCAIGHSVRRRPAWFLKWSCSTFRTWNAAHALPTRE